MALLSDKTKKAIAALYPKYEVRDSAIMPALYLVQDQLGYVPDTAVEELAAFMQLPVVKIQEVLQFYTMYHTEPVGKYHFQICRNLTCCMFDAQSICDEIKTCTGLTRPKEVTGDGLFSYEEVECLGSCGTAPVVMINDRYHESFQKGQVQTFVQRIRHEEKPPKAKIEAKR